MRTWQQFVREALAGEFFSDVLAGKRKLGSLDEGREPEFCFGDPNVIWADQSVMKFDDPTAQTLAQLAGATPNQYVFTPKWEGFLARPFSAACPSMELAAASLTYPREDESSRLSAIRTHVTSQAAAESAVLVVQSTAGMYVGQVIYVFSTSTLTRTILTVDSTTQITFTEAHGETVPDNSIVVSQEYTITAEGGQPPYTLIKSSSVTATMYALPVLAQMSRQALVYQNLLSIYGERMPRYAAASLSKALLYGVGSGTIPGLLNTSGIQDYDWSDGVEGDTRADALLRAWAKIRTDGAKEAWCNVDDLITMATAKGASEGSYLMSSLAPVNLTLSEGGLRVGWLPVGVDNSFASGNFLVIDHAASHTVLRDARLTGLDLGTAGDDFKLGMLHARYSQQVGHAIYAFGGFVGGDWDAAPGA